MADVERVPSNWLGYDAVSSRHTLDGVPFTGTVYSVWPNGQLDCESELREGLNWGASRCWYSTGAKFGEAAMRAGVVHGKSREWHPEGRLKAEGEYEYGIALWEREWSADGALTREYKLTEADRAYKSLASLRRAYGGSPDAEPVAAADTA